MKKSKYATLDKRILAAIGARRKRTRMRIYQDKFVWRESGRVLAGTWNTARALVSRRLQALRRDGVIECNWFTRRWRITPETGGCPR